MSALAAQVFRQGTPEWHAERLGRVTASNFACLLSKPKKKGEVWSVAAHTYARKLVAERLTGVPQDEAAGRAIDWGNEQEEPARQAYERATSREVIAAPFLAHSIYPTIGASVDGLVGEDRTQEIKCPWNSWRHVDNVLSGVVPAEYVAQVQGGLWVTGRKVCDFVSFDPRNERCPICVVEVPRDDELISELSERCVAFAEYVDELEAELCPA